MYQISDVYISLWNIPYARLNFLQNKNCKKVFENVAMFFFINNGGKRKNFE